LRLTTVRVKAVHEIGHLQPMRVTQYGLGPNADNGTTTGRIRAPALGP